MFEIWGIRGYIPEGFLTACSFDYLDASGPNFWFIMIYAFVSIQQCAKKFLKVFHPTHGVFN